MKLNWQIAATNWKSVKSQIKNLNPELYEIINKISPPDSMELFIAEYPYGTKILDEGLLQLSDEKGRTISIAHEDFPKHIKEKLSYSSIPFAMCMNKYSEVYITINQRVIPLNNVPIGGFFGLFEVLSEILGLISTPIWSVHAGARSTFMLPRISDTVCHRRLKKELGINVDVPKQPDEHAEIFRQINLAQPKEKQWYSKIALFSKDWIDAIEKDPAWITLKNYFYTTTWTYAQRFMGERANNILWEALAATIAAKRLKPRQYLVDTVKHLYYIGLENLPGFGIALNDELLPIEAIQDAYTTVYLLKENAPIIAEPRMLNHNNKQLYYFMTYPTLLGGHPSYRGTPSILLDLRDMRTMIQALQQKYIEKIPPSIMRLVKHIGFQYYHQEHDPFDEVKECSLIPLEDNAIKKACAMTKNNNFPITSSLMPGVIKISINDGQKNEKK